MPYLASVAEILPFCSDMLRFSIENQFNNCPSLCLHNGVLGALGIAVYVQKIGWGKGRHKSDTEKIIRLIHDNAP